MANFSVKCPACGESITCDDESRGMNVECPYCKQEITVPTKEMPLEQSSFTKKSESSEPAGKVSFQDDEKRPRILALHYCLAVIVLLVFIGIAKSYFGKGGLPAIMREKDAMESAIKIREDEVQADIKMMKFEKEIKIKEVEAERKAYKEKAKAPLYAYIEQMELQIQAYREKMEKRKEK